jgi:site-specific recombinase XerD
VQQLLGHENVETTMISTSVAGGSGAQSPLDHLD